MIAEARARALIAAARARGWRIATAESCTGGLVAAALTDVPGSSDVFDRGFVTYSYPAKVAMLGVPQALLTEHGAVSEPVARAMAEGALAASDADARGRGHRRRRAGRARSAKPEGLVWFAAATADGARRASAATSARSGATGSGARSVETALEPARFRRVAAGAVERLGAPLEGADDPQHRLVEDEADQLLQDRRAELEVDEEVDLAGPVAVGDEAPVVLQVAERPLEILDVDGARLRAQRHPAAESLAVDLEGDDEVGLHHLAGAVGQRRAARGRARRRTRAGTPG